MLGRGVGSVQAGALALQVPSVYARSYIRLDPILRAYRARESRRPLEKTTTGEISRRSICVSNHRCVPPSDLMKNNLNRHSISHNLSSSRSVL